MCHVHNTLKHLIRSLGIIAILTIGLLVVIGSGGGSGFSFYCSPPPEIRSTPPTEATVGETYVYVVDAIHECGFLPSVCTDFLVLQSPPETATYSKSITWTPSVAYENTYVQFRISTVPDYCGDSVQQAWSVYVHPAPPDTTPPDVSAVTPGVDAVNVPVTSTIRIYFTEAIDPQSVTTSSVLVSGPTGPIPGTFDTSSNAIVFTPVMNLPYSSLITVTITTAVSDLSGNGMAADYTWSFTTGDAPDTTPPTIPTGLVTTHLSGSEVRLSWDNSTDDVALAGYDVYRNGAYLLSVTNPEVPSDAGLDFNTEYCYTVSAYDTSDNHSAQSSPLCVSTLEFVAGTVATWGYTLRENGTFYSRTIPDIEPGINDIKEAVLGYNQRSAVLLDGTVWQWGATPEMVPGLSNAVVVGAGHSHTLAITSDGDVMGWGANNYGQLGDNTNTDATDPVQMVDVSQAIAVDGGLGHSLVLRSNGTVWATGGNWFGQLGDGTTVEKISPVQVIGLTDVTAISACWNYSLALKSDGSVWTWGGSNYYTYYSTPTLVASLSNITTISQGLGFALALADDGTVWAWGHNGSGQLGDGTTTDRAQPVQVTGLSNVVAISAGNYHAMALTNDGQVWAWGANNDGQLGDGTLLNRLTPVQVLKVSGVKNIAAGASSSLAIK